MGRLESLTALALGRGHYEEEVIINLEAEPPAGPNPQQYNDRGYPRNPETKRQEREHVRAANEVMQVTGVVEDSQAATQKQRQFNIDKDQETFTGMRLLEVGRAVFIGGTWGVLGLRRRILLYKPYSDMGVLQIMQYEESKHSIPRLFAAGMPALLVYQISDFVLPIAGKIILRVLGPNEDRDSLLPPGLQTLSRFGFHFACTHLRLFSILQQINLVPASWLLPSLKSFFPFTRASPLRLPSTPSLGISSLCTFTVSLAWTAAPMLLVWAYTKFQKKIKMSVYRHVFKLLPRPTGDSMYAPTPIIELDVSDQAMEERSRYRTEDEPTLRALEGRPTLERGDTRIPQTEGNHDSSDDEEEELTQATLISFDVEATDVIESSIGTWSAELRSANEPKTSQTLRYHVTGLTMLPINMATEGIQQIVTAIIALPLETLMVRVVGRAYRASAGIGMEDMFLWEIPAVGNLLTIFALELVVKGFIWTGYTTATQWLAARWRVERAEH